MSERWCYVDQQERKKVAEKPMASAEGFDGSIAGTKDRNLGEKEGAIRARLEKFAYFKGGEGDNSQPEHGADQVVEGRERLSHECRVCGKLFRLQHLLINHQNSHNQRETVQAL